MTDERRVDAVLSYSLPRERDRLSAAFGFTRVRSLTSMGGRDDESYLEKGLGAYFGYPESPYNEAFLVYGGNEPYFRKSTADAWSLRADYERWTPRGSGGKAGLGGSYHGVEFREMDVTTYGTGLDSLRSYQAFAPGAFAYAQGRWVFEGLILNAGLRGEYFTAGTQAKDQSFSEPAGGMWSLSPRLGIAYPISSRDVFSLAYIRVQQNPARDFLYDQRTKPNNYRPLGNPAIEPATVISWQAALKHLIGERWSLQGAVFVRDVYGEVGARNFVAPNSVPWFRYEGADDAHATGWELSLARAEEAGTNLELHYTWMMANGSESLEEGLPYYLRTGFRPVPIGVHTLNWDRRHTLTLALWREWRDVALSWSTQAGSGLPWTPATARQLEGDLSRVNTRRLDWTEWSALSLRWSPAWLRSRASVGVEVRNVFDFRGAARATVDGYPHPVINTIYDDYGAFREETGLGGGAWWDDANGDRIPRWARVHDPRLDTPPRTVRLSLGANW
jgi:outer membrane receptor protein involved in Fe transport